MAKKKSLLKTSIELLREFKTDQAIYYKLIIGTDPETKVVITDDNLENLLMDLPKLLSTVIQSHILVDSNYQQKRSNKNESTGI